MFTGIVEELGTVRSINNGVLEVDALVTLEDLEVKDSICVNGACLTVTELTETGFRVDVVPETLRRTSLGELIFGSMVNLERSLKMGGRIGGIWSRDMWTVQAKYHLSLPTETHICIALLFHLN